MRLPTAHHDRAPLQGRAGRRRRRRDPTGRRAGSSRTPTETRSRTAIVHGTGVTAWTRMGCRMRVVVNLTRCQGYAQCAFLAPDVFRMRGDEVLMYDPEPDDAQRERVQRAAAACPVQAIRADRIEDSHAAAAAPGMAVATAAVPARTAPSSGGQT